MIYLDNATTTGPKPQEVYQAVSTCLQRIGGNPGRGMHEGAHLATNIIEQARVELAGLFNAPSSSHIIFTLNATDAMNTALQGLLVPGQHVVTTCMEHNAVSRPLRYLESIGVKVTLIPCDRCGRLNIDKMKKVISEGVDAVVMIHASNITGTIMPVYEIGQYAAKYNTKFIVDASQTAGVEDIDVVKMAVTALIFSGHKGLLGPQGTGGLYLKEGITIRPLRFGGTGQLSESDQQPEEMPERLESGSPNTPGIAGLLAGVRFIREIGIENIRHKEKEFTTRLLNGLSNIKGVTIYGPQNLVEHTAVVSFTINNVTIKNINNALAQEFDIACRSGLHCAPWAHQTIGTIHTGTIRFSPGYFNTTEDIDQALDAVRKVAQRARQ